MVVRVSWRSFSSRVIGRRLLSGFQDEGVVIQQRQWVGGELIEFRIAELQGGLWVAAWRGLGQEVGHIIGAEGTGGESFPQGRGDLFGSVSPEQIEQFAKLTNQRTIRIRSTT